MELQITGIEERLDQVTSDLTVANGDKHELQEELEREKAASKVNKGVFLLLMTLYHNSCLYFWCQVLQAEVEELSVKLESQDKDAYVSAGDVQSTESVDGQLREESVLSTSPSVLAAGERVSN